MSGLRRGQLAFVLGAAAVLWAVLLVVAAFTWPAYEGEQCGSSGCTVWRTTMFHENGWWVIELLAGVALIALLAFWALHVLCSKGSNRAAKLATGCVLALAAFAFVSGFSIGPFVFPVVVLLTASALLTPLPRNSGPPT